MNSFDQHELIAEIVATLLGFIAIFLALSKQNRATSKAFINYRPDHPADYFSAAVF